MGGVLFIFMGSGCGRELKIKTTLSLLYILTAHYRQILIAYMPELVLYYGRGVGRRYDRHNKSVVVGRRAFDFRRRARDSIELFFEVLSLVHVLFSCNSVGILFRTVSTQ